MWRRPWIPRLPPAVLLVVGLVAFAALARTGGGESFSSGSGSSSDDLGGAIIGCLFEFLIDLAIDHPAVGCPLLVLFVLGLWWFQRQSSGPATQRAIDQAEAQRRTATTTSQVEQWIAALKQKDPAFELLPFLDRTNTLFLQVQEAWFRQNLEPVRRFLSDATWQRLAAQLKLLELQGVRDAVTDLKVLDLSIIGLEQTEHFDTLHIRVKATARDDDAPSSFTEDQARALAAKKAPETFVEVWSFVRKPGAATKAGGLLQGQCPSCGAPFDGGASNACAYCKAVVNSGQYDWVLAEITQGSVYSPGDHTADGYAGLRQRDPGLTLEGLEDRASLCFWKWIDAQSTANAGKVAKVASESFRTNLAAELAGLQAAGRRKVYLECAVGSVDTRAFSQDNGFDLAHLEVRWSARLGVGPVGERPPGNLPTIPVRSVLVLERRQGAQTPVGRGLASSRCPGCGAPLSDNGQTSCEYCGAALATGEKDWVLHELLTWEQWASRGYLARQARVQAARLADKVPVQEERQRLLYVMAAMAMADGVLDERERRLLRMCSERWRVPWPNVEMALKSGGQLAERLLAKGSADAEQFLRQLVELALVDGKIDRKERQMLEAAAQHLGVPGALKGMIGNA